MDTERPQNWDDYVGQERMKERLETHIEAANQAYEPMAHVLLCGPPGCGKTTLAMLIAEKKQEPLAAIIMPIKSDDMVRLVRRHHGILFLDEIHRASQKQQEELLPLLEDGYMQLPGGQRIQNNWLTIVGATTEPENVIPPLYDRFTLKPAFEPYTEAQMETMVLGMALRAQIELTDGVINLLAVASNGLPRNARQLVAAARALTLTDQELTAATVLELAGVTSDGLSDQHVEYLRVLDMLGGKAGMAPLSTVLRLSSQVVQELERVLFEKDMITFRSTGRELTTRGYDTINKEILHG